MHEWTPDGNPKMVGHATIQYLRSGGHGHEGAHDIWLSNGDELRIYPTSTTTARGRSRVILRAIGESHGVDGINQTAYVIGALAIYGAIEIDLNGERLGPEGGHTQWQVDLHDDGSVVAKWKGERP
jgi:hypothetical protein